MNREIAELREVITKLVPMLTGKGLRVTQRGSQAFVQANAKTNKPEVVNIPSIPDNATSDFIAAISGFIDHEVGHVLFTDWKFYGGDGVRVDKFSAEGRALTHAHNIVEDTFIEREIVKVFPGSKSNLRQLHEHFIDRITRKALAQATEDKEQFGILFVPFVRALSGQQVFIDFMDEGHWEHPMIKNIHMALSDATLDLIKTAGSTQDTLRAAQEIHDILFNRPEEKPEEPEQPEQSQPQQPESQENDGDEGESESQDAPEQQAGEGDGDGERDHSESEPGEDGETGDGPEPDDAGDESDGDDKSEDGGEDADEDGEADEADGAGGESDEESSDESEADGGDDDAGEDDDAGDEAGEGSGGEGVDETDQSGAASAGEAQNEEDGTDQQGGETERDEEGGYGGSAGTSMFDLDPEDFQPVDLSQALAKEISDMAERALDGSNYSTFTRDDDRIEVFDPDQLGIQVESDWIPSMEEDCMGMVGKMQKDIERMMAAQSYAIRTPGHTRGKLHAPSLYRVMQGDPRVFSQREEIRSKDTAVTLLIDNSGSMWGDNLRIAMTAAYALASTLERVNIPNEVIGFTTGDLSRASYQAFSKDPNAYSFSRTCAIVMPIFKEFRERVTPTVKKRIAAQMKAQVGCNTNVDGESLEYAALRLIPRPEKRKVMLVMSDGQPVGTGSSAHLKMTVKRLTDMGIETVGIGINTHAVRQYYPRYTVLNDVETLPATVMGELRRILS